MDHKLKLHDVIIHTKKCKKSIVKKPIEKLQQNTKKYSINPKGSKKGGTEEQKI